VSPRVDLAVSPLDLSVGTNPVGDPSGGGGVRRFTGPVSEADLTRGVAEEREAETLLLGERRIAPDAVEGGTENLDAAAVELLLEVAEPATLGGSPEGVGLRVEPEDDPLPSEIGEAASRAGVVADLEVRCDIAGRKEIRSGTGAEQHDPDDSSTYRGADASGVAPSQVSAESS
jgi:hypothetical protein